VNEAPRLGLVVIGRDPGASLSRLLSAVRPYGFSEVVFVDSGSRDGSAHVAAAAGCRVVTLPRSAEGAAAARAAGTLACGAEWILYLDSDMTPDLATVARLHGALGALPPGVAGCTALIRDRYPDGTSRVRHAYERTGQPASYFGGAVLLRRSSVLAAGNWNPRVLANEELDLHARLRSRGEHVIFERAVLVDHFTAKLDVASKVGFLVNWRGRAGGRYGAPGQALRSCVQRGAMRHLMMLCPEPFVATPLTVIAVTLITAGSPWIGVALLAGLWGWIARRRGVPYIVPAYLLFPQILIGYHRSGGRRA
jgi:hypothetical protein